MKKKEVINEKEIKLKKTLQEINKTLGIGCLKMGGNVAEKKRLKTSIPEFNKLIGGGIPCFAKGTKVLMSNYTWRNIEDVESDELILGFNENNYRLVESKVIKTYKSITTDLVFLKTNKQSVLTTKNHRFLTIEIKGHRKWSKAINLNKHSNFYHFPIYERNSEWKRGWLLGVLCSDGNFSKDRYRFTFYNNNIKLIKFFIKNIFEIYYKKVNICNYKNGNTYRVTVSSKTICSILLTEKEMLKHQPNLLSLDFLRGFMGGYYDGDGGMGVYGGLRYYSSKKSHLKILQNITILLGFKHSKFYKMSDQHISVFGAKSYMSKPEYCMSITPTIKWILTCLPYSKNKCKLTINKRSQDRHELLFKVLPNRRADRSKREIEVYNLQTETGTYIANGFPVHNCGQFSIAWGNKGSGKTTLAYDFIAQAQKEKKVCMFLDLECSFDAERAESIGVDTSKLIVGHFTTAEEAMDTLVTVCKEKVVDLIVLDSIQAMSPKGEQETKKGKVKSIESDEVALLARKLSKFFRVSAHSVYEGNVAILLIGQARVNLSGFIPFDSLSGGNALGHWASLIVKLRRGAKVDSPYLSTKENVYDKQGKQEFKKNGDAKQKTVRTISGFDCVIKVEKTKIKSMPELSDVHLPFYKNTGFKMPEAEIKEIKEEEKEVKEQIKDNKGDK